MSTAIVESPQEIIARAHRSHEKIAISFSGAEDVVLIDMAFKMGLEVNAFCLDTGRLHAETVTFIDQVEAHYKIQIKRLHPNSSAVDTFVKDKGLFSFYEDGHEECCNIRKIEPLRAHLLSLNAWVTGQRQDQSPTRADVPQQQVDTAFSTADNALTKYNPLSFWSSQQVWEYIAAHDVPHNSLHDRGYLSIGCEPCTRAIKPGEHERAGRWWWEESTQRECGLHAINLKEVS